MEDKLCLSTGELADMLGVSKQTLLYYDKIGLLIPAGRDEKGYRSYTLEQADELDTILTFRSLGVSIDTIREYLSQKTAQGCIALLERQQHAVDRELRALRRQKRKLAQRIRLLHSAADCRDPEEVRFLSLPQEDYLVERCRGEDAKSVMEGFIDLCRHSKTLEIDFENPVCSIIGQSDVEAGRFHRISYYGIRLPTSADVAPSLRRRRAAGLYGTTYHKGPYESLPVAYERLLRAIGQAGLAVCSDAYELDLLSTMTSADPNDYLKLLSIQVQGEGDTAALR